MTEYYTEMPGPQLKKVRCKLITDDDYGQCLVLGEHAVQVLRLRSDGCIELNFIDPRVAREFGLCLSASNRVTVCHA